jgi:hypothetical protein
MSESESEYKMNYATEVYDETCPVSSVLPPNPTLSQRIQAIHGRRIHILCRIQALQRAFTQLGLDLVNDSLPAAKIIHSTIDSAIFKNIEMAFLATSRAKLAELIDQMDPDSEMAKAVKSKESNSDLRDQLRSKIYGKDA